MLDIVLNVRKSGLVPRWGRRESEYLNFENTVYGVRSWPIYLSVVRLIDAVSY